MVSTQSRGLFRRGRKDLGNNENNDDNDDDDAKGDIIESDDVQHLSRREIVVSASIILPFEADVAFDAFSDLPRQPSWSSWLHSVSYIDDDADDDDYSMKLIEEEEREKRIALYQKKDVNVDELRQTKWIMGWKKIRFSWKSKVTSMERPRSIEWTSISGLKNMGKVTFEEEFPLDHQETFIAHDDGDNESTEQLTKTEDDDDVVKTYMTLTLKFIAPRIVASLMKRSDKIASFMKTQILRPTLMKFRDVVLINDLGRDAHHGILEQNKS